MKLRHTRKELPPEKFGAFKTIIDRRGYYVVHALTIADIEDGVSMEYLDHQIVVPRAHMEFNKFLQDNRLEMRKGYQHYVIKPKKL